MECQPLLRQPQEDMSIYHNGSAGGRGTWERLAGNQKWGSGG